MLNNLDAVKTNFKYNIPGGFRLFSTFNKPGVGEVNILSNSEAFILSKTISRDLLDPSEKFIAQLKKIATPIRGVQKFEGFDQNTQQGVLRPIFSFSGDLLSPIHEAARANKKPISESVVWKVYQDISSALKVLEQTGLYHPFVSIDNIFFQDGTFKLTNPFLFDSFLKEQRDLVAADPQTFAQKIRDKQLENSTQLGYSLMQLASLVTDEEIRDGVKYKKDNLRECMRVSNAVYSPDLNTTIEKLIKGKEALGPGPAQSRPNLQPSKVNTEPSAENSLLGRHKLVDPKPQGEALRPSGPPALDRSIRPSLAQAAFNPAFDAQHTSHMPGDFVPRGAPKPSPSGNKPLISPEPVVSQIAGEQAKPAGRFPNNPDDSEVFAHDLKNKNMLIGEKPEAEKPENQQNVSLVNDGRDQSRGKLSRWALAGEHGGLNEVSFVDPKQPIIRNDINSIRKQPKVFFEDDSIDEKVLKQKQTAEFGEPLADPSPNNGLREPAPANPSKTPHENSRANATNQNNQSHSSIRERRKGNVSGYVFKDTNMNDQSLMEYSRYTERNVLPPNINQTVASAKDSPSLRHANPETQSQYYMPPTSLPHLGSGQHPSEQPRIAELKNLIFADSKSPQALHNFARNSVLEPYVQHPAPPETDTLYVDRLLAPNRSSQRLNAPPLGPEPDLTAAPGAARQLKSDELKRLLFEENLNNSQNEISSIDYGRQSIRTTGSLAKEILRDMHIPLNYVPERVPFTEEPSEEFFLDPTDDPAPIFVDFNKPKPQPKPIEAPLQAPPPPENRPAVLLPIVEYRPQPTIIPYSSSNGYVTHTYHRLPYSHPELAPVDQPEQRLPRAERPKEKLNRSVYKNIISVNPDGSIPRRSEVVSQPRVRDSLPKQILSFTTVNNGTAEPKPQPAQERKLVAAPPPVQQPVARPRPISPSSGSNPLKRAANFPGDTQKPPNRQYWPSNSSYGDFSHSPQQLAAGSGARPY